GLAVEDGHLAERLARAEQGDERLLAVRRDDRDLHQAVADDVEAGAGVVAVEDDLALAEGARPGGGGEGGELGGREVVEEVGLGERAEERFGLGDGARRHGESLSERPTAMPAPFGWQHSGRT